MTELLHSGGETIPASDTEGQATDIYCAAA